MISIKTDTEKRTTRRFCMWQREIEDMNIEGFNLMLQDFCGYCGCFEPEIERHRCDTEWGETPKYTNTIRCKSRQKCARIAENLNDKINGKSKT